MIQANEGSWQTTPWQRELARAITDPAELLTLLDLPEDLLPGARAAAGDFRVRVPRSYAARIRSGDPADPLLRQVLPVAAELDAHTDYCRDPVGDLGAMPLPGVVQKYRGRTLLVTTGACAVHCRYCFRRHFPYSEANPAANQWKHALHHIASDSSIGEVILSGGDPLSLSDQRLTALTQELSRIRHLKRLRIHTRLPVMVPSRVTGELQRWLQATRLQKIIVIHANHAQEIDEQVGRAMRTLGSYGVTLFNQAVLLRGVNDSVPAQVALSERLFSVGVLPYYLHQLDKVQGAAHFFVDDATAQEIIAGVRAALPGYLVPRLVAERRNQAAKLVLG